MQFCLFFREPMCAKTRAGARRAAHIRISIGDSCKTVKDSKGTFGPNVHSSALRQRSTVPPPNPWPSKCDARRAAAAEGVRTRPAATRGRKAVCGHEKAPGRRVLHLFHRRALHEFALGIATVLGSRRSRRTLGEFSLSITTLLSRRDSAAEPADQNARDRRSNKT